MVFVFYNLLSENARKNGTEVSETKETWTNDIHIIVELSFFFRDIESYLIYFSNERKKVLKVTVERNEKLWARFTNDH